jgi:uncharacterized protein YegL
MPLNELQQVEFAQNPEQRCPCVLVIDVSGSMKGEPIDALNEALQRFQAECANDDQASRRVEVALITFATDVRVVQDFVTVDKFVPPTLEADGVTALGSAVLKALDIVEERKKVYRDAAISYFRPWMFLITDGAPYGEPEDAFPEAVQKVRQAEQEKKLSFFAVGVQEADIELLNQFSARGAMPLKGLRFVELFVWLSRSMQRVSASRTGENVKLESPESWGEVSS